MPTAVPGLVRFSSMVAPSAAGECAPVRFGQSEIEDLCLAALGDENVRRLDVAVHDSFGMRRVERVGHFDGERKQSLGFHRLPVDAMFQGDAIQELHGDERLAVLLADVVNGADVGVIQSGCSLGFALETGEGLRVSGDFAGAETSGRRSVAVGCLRLYKPRPSPHRPASRRFGSARWSAQS